MMSKQHALVECVPAVFEGTTKPLQSKRKLQTSSQQARSDVG
jgi:hypothetical protein